MRLVNSEMRSTTSSRHQQAEEKFVGLAAIEENTGESDRRVQLKFLTFYANARVYGTVFRVAAGSHGGTTLNLRPRTDVVQSYRRVRLIFNKNYEGERVWGARLKNLPAPGGTRWPRNLKLRKLGSHTTG